MSIKSKVFAAAATLTLVGGVGAAGTLAGGTAYAGTPSCGIACVNLFSYQYGTHETPTFVVDVLRQGQKVGQPIILFRTSNADPAEDWTASFQGTVADFYAAGMVTAAFALHYGCIPTGTTVYPADAANFPDCFGTQLTLNDPAFEIEYTPLGQFSGLCVGVASTAVQEEGVTLQECGASSKTVWAVDLFDQPFDTFGTHYVPLINGSDTNFSQPYVLTYPQSGYPTDRPRPQLQVDNLTGYSMSFPPTFPLILNYPTIPDYQLWGGDLGGTHIGI
jgi:hypothetical protein